MSSNREQKRTKKIMTPGKSQDVLCLFCCWTPPPNWEEGRGEGGGGRGGGGRGEGGGGRGGGGEGGGGDAGRRGGGLVLAMQVPEILAISRVSG